MNDQYEVIAPQTVVDASLMELVTKAEIDTQIATAKRYPRSIRQFINDATEMVTLNEEVATSCNYGLPRGGKIIEGPSARFAELIYGAWGNSRAGSRIVHEDDRFVTAQGVCHDLQRNTMITFEVKRRITDSKNKKYNDDMIGVTGSAAASIALRNAILKVIPKAFWHPIYVQARKVSMGDSKTLATRRADALAIMQKFGVTLEMILTRFELKGVEDISLEHLATLKACAMSIRDGEATAESLFPTEKPAETEEKKKGTEAVKDIIKNKSSGAAKKDDSKTDNAGTSADENKAGASNLSSNEDGVGNLIDLSTQELTKAAAEDLLSILNTATPESRLSEFVNNFGNEIVGAMGKHGLNLMKKQFSTLGINLPTEAA